MALAKYKFSKNDGFSLVEVPAARADEIITALRATKIRGLKVTVRRERVK